MTISRDSLNIRILHFPWANLYNTGRSRAQVLITLKYSNKIAVGNKVVAVYLCFCISLSDLGEHYFRNIWTSSDHIFHLQQKITKAICILWKTSRWQESALSNLNVCFQALLKLHNWSVKEADTINGVSALKNPREARFTPYYIGKLNTFLWPTTAF